MVAGDGDGYGVDLVRLCDGVWNTCVIGVGVRLHGFYVLQISTGGLMGARFMLYIIDVRIVHTENC